MFDGNWREAVDRGLTPIGVSLRRTGVSADMVTITGIVMATGAAVAIATGNLRLGFLLLILTGIPDALDGAVAKASGTSSQRGAFFDSVSDRLTDALLFGGLAWYLADSEPGHMMMLPVAVMSLAMLVSYQRAKAESLGLQRQGRHHGAGRAIHRARLRPAVQRAAGVDPLADARAHSSHRRSTVRQGLEAGVQGPAG